MARQYGSHTERSKEILIEKEAQRKRKEQMNKKISIGLCALFVVIGCVSILNNVMSKKSLDAQIVTLTQTRDEKKTEWETLDDELTTHDETMAQYVSNGKTSLEYDTAVAIFENDPYVTVSAIEPISISDIGQQVCDYQNEINDFTYDRYLTDDEDVSKEEGDLLLEYRTYVPDFVDRWSEPLLDTYEFAVKNRYESKDFKSHLSETVPFSWSFSADYTSIVESKTLPVVWKCRLNSEENTLMAIVTGIYNTDIGKFTNMKLTKTLMFYDYISDVSGNAVDIEDLVDDENEDEEEEEMIDYGS